jgi:hypothetical protein
LLFWWSHSHDVGETLQSLRFLSEILNAQNHMVMVIVFAGYPKRVIVVVLQRTFLQIALIKKRKNW